MDDMPDMTTAGWVEHQRQLRPWLRLHGRHDDRASRRVTRIESATPLPLRQCHADPRLPPHVGGPRRDPADAKEPQ